MKHALNGLGFCSFETKAPARLGKRDVVEIGSTASVHEAKGAGPQAHPLTEGRQRPGVIPLRAISFRDWSDLAARAVEPNAYYSPEWASAVDASARGRSNLFALAAHNQHKRLTGLLPVVSSWRAWNLPLPILVAADPYGPLGTPLLDQDEPSAAAAALIQHAQRHGAHALVLRDIPLAGRVAELFTCAMKTGLEPRILHAHERACLDTTGNAEVLLRDALGAKKLKELRRQRNRLGDQGEVVFSVAKTSDDVAAALDTFLALEASGWKGARGTALVQHAGDATFIRRATVAMAARGACEIVTLRAGDTPVASGVVLRHQNRAFWFKLGVDERFAKLSPGVQLALDLTKYLCDDPTITCVDSSTNAGPHTMIDPIWRGRLAIGDLIIPLKRHSPVVPLLIAAIRTRSRARLFARQALNQLQNLKEKRQ